MKHQHFLTYIQDYITKNPEIAAHVANYVQQGLNSALSEANQRAANMESALAIALAKRYPNRDDVIKQMIIKCGPTSNNWDWLLKDESK